MQHWFTLEEIENRARQEGLSKFDWGEQTIRGVIFRNEFNAGEVGWAVRAAVVNMDMGEKGWWLQPDPPRDVSQESLRSWTTEPPEWPEFEAFEGDYRLGVWDTLIVGSAKEAASENDNDFTEALAFRRPEEAFKALAIAEIGSFSKRERGILRYIAVKRDALIRWCGEMELLFPAFLGERNDPRTHSGGPGRPTPKNIVVQEFERRAKAGVCEAKVSDEARMLGEWLNRNHPDLRQLTAKTIENSIRTDFRIKFPLKL